MAIVNEKMVLIVAPNFYGYEVEISKEMQCQGFIVTELFFEGFHRKQFSKKGAEKQYWENLLNEFTSIVSVNKFDFLFVINTEWVGIPLLKLFGQANPLAKKIIYLWDSIKNLNWESFYDIIECYDYKFSFDRKDCEIHPALGLKHRPNFYHPLIEKMQRNENPEFQVATVMSAQTDRIKFLNLFYAMYPKMKVALYIHLLTLKSIPAYLLNHSILINPRYIKLRKIPLSQTLELINNSASVLDIPANDQLGFPFRTLDTIGLYKKLITTNPDAVNYDFYHPDNVLVINLNELWKIKIFLETPFHIIDQNIIQKYSIRFWVSSLFSNEKVSYVK